MKLPEVFTKKRKKWADVPFNTDSLPNTAFVLKMHKTKTDWQDVLRRVMKECTATGRMELADSGETVTIKLFANCQPDEMTRIMRIPTVKASIQNIYMAPHGQQVENIFWADEHICGPCEARTRDCCDPRFAFLKYPPYSQDNAYPSYPYHYHSCDQYQQQQSYFPPPPLPGAEPSSYAIQWSHPEQPQLLLPPSADPYAGGYNNYHPYSGWSQPGQVEPPYYYDNYNNQDYSLCSIM